MAVIDDKLCKGCICSECQKSEYNGHLHGCSLHRCDVCDDDTGVFKLQSCADVQAYKERDADDLRL